MSQTTVSDVAPIIWSDDVNALCVWASTHLGLTESWRASDDNGVVEHAELLWPGGRVSINIRAPMYQDMGPSGICLRLDDKSQIDALHSQAQAAGANITQPLGDSPVAYSFTATDPDGNQWWVNAETGMLDELRKQTG